MKRNDDPYRDTLSEVAKWFGLSKSAVEEWNLADDAPKKSKRGYNLHQWAMWLAKQKYRVVPKDSPDYRLKTLRVEEKELELQKIKGEMMTVKQHMDERMALVDAFTRACERAAAELAPQVAGKSAAEARRAIEAWQARVREELAGGNGDRVGE